MILVRIAEASRRLDRHVQNAQLHLFFRAFIQRAVADPALEISPVHPLREDRRHTPDLSHIITGDDVGMQAQVDPVLALSDKYLLSALARLSEKDRLRTFHSQFCVPALMVYFPHVAHPARDRIRAHDIRIQKLFAAVDPFVGDRRLLLPSAGAAGGVFQRSKR